MYRRRHFLCRIEIHAVIGYRIPEKNILMSTGTPKQKVEMLKAAQELKAKGYNIFATGGTSKFLAENGVENTRILAE